MLKVDQYEFIRTGYSDREFRDRLIIDNIAAIRYECL